MLQISEGTTIYFLSAACTLLLIVVTVLPLFPFGYWWIRVLDFPRVQILLLALTLFCGIVVFSGDILSGRQASVLIPLSSVILYQAACVTLFLPFSRVEVPVAEAAEERVALRVLTVNVRYDNTNFESFLSLLEENPCDLLLVSELNTSWQQALEAISAELPHRIEAVRDDGHGIGLFSKFPLEGEKVRFLVSDQRPSVFATVHVGKQEKIDVWGVHPAPPGIQMTDGERKNSRPRDAELLIVAKEAAQASNPILVLGDFNDTAWSRTTKLFKNVSGLFDPRRGRGLFNTYHVDYPLLRYPIDHVFVSKHFALFQLEKLRSFGSDHFPMYAHLSLITNRSQDPSSPNETTEPVAEIIERGKGLASEYESKEEIS